MQPIIKEKVRILRPGEYEQLRASLKENPDRQVLLDGLLITGMRYVEAQALQGHPELVDGRFIKTDSKKVQTKFKERWIRLSDYGTLIIDRFIKNDAKLPTRQSFDETLKRWAKNADLEEGGICCKTFRKTWESWLVFYYPTHQLEIAQSQGHTAMTQMQHYLNLPFTTEDKIKMSKWLDGMYDDRAVIEVKEGMR
jgi:integrase